MTAANRPVGELACETPQCGRLVVVTETSTGKLSYRCLYCSKGAFADKGGQAFKTWTKALKPMPGADDPPAPVHQKPPPASKTGPSAFTMGL